jgi:hypothetical protein
MLRRTLPPASLLLILAVAPRVGAEPPLVQIDHKSPVQCVAWSPDGKVLATAAHDGSIYLTDIPSGILLRRGNRVRLFGTGHIVLGMAFSPDGKTLAVREFGQSMSTWDLTTGKRLRVGGFVNYKSHQLAFTRDGLTVVAVAYGEFVHWTVAGGASGSMWNNPPAGGYAAVAEDGAICGWGNPNGQIQMQQSQPRVITSLQVGPARSMAFGPGAKTLAVGGADKNVYLWDLAKREKKATLSGLKAEPTLLSFAADGSTLAALAADSSHIRVWDVGRLRTRRLLTNPRGAVTSLALSPDGKYLATVAADGKALVWNVATRELELTTPPAELPKEELLALWKDLASDDFNKSDAAWRRLATCGDNAVAFLKEQIRPISEPPVDAKRVEKLIAELDSPKYAVRDKAHKELVTCGELVITPLQKLIANPPSEEARTRAEKILKKVKEPVLTPERQRVLEAMELLEAVKTPLAKQVLEEIARDTLIAQFRQEALLALERWQRAKDEK